MNDGNLSVLIVEDERALADAYAHWLRPEYDVHVSYTGEQALEVFQEDIEIDVVLLDRRLPGLSGDEVLAEMRERDLDCRVAMITAIDPDYDILGMEFDDYLRKPVLEDELHEVVERLATMGTYDDRLRTSYRLASKLASLEREKPSSELETHGEYQHLKTRFLQLTQNIESIASEFTADEFSRAYRELGGVDDSENVGKRE